MNIGSTLHQTNISNQPKLSTIQQLKIFHQAQLQKERDYQEKANKYTQNLKMNYIKTFGCNPDKYSQVQGIFFNIIFLFEKYNYNFILETIKKNLKNILGINKTQEVQQNANDQAHLDTTKQNDFNIDENYEQKGYYFLIHTFEVIVVYG